MFNHFKDRNISVPNSFVLSNNIFGSPGTSVCVEECDERCVARGKVGSNGRKNSKIPDVLQAEKSLKFQLMTQRP